MACAILDVSPGRSFIEVHSAEAGGKFGSLHCPQDNVSPEKLQDDVTSLNAEGNSFSATRSGLGYSSVVMEAAWSR